MYSRITKILVGGGRGYACTGKDIKRQLMRHNVYICSYYMSKYI